MQVPAHELFELRNIKHALDQAAIALTQMLLNAAEAMRGTGRIQHGGRLTIESEEGRGAMATLTVPLTIPQPRD